MSVLESGGKEKKVKPTKIKKKDAAPRRIETIDAMGAVTSITRRFFGNVLTLLTIGDTERLCDERHAHFLV